MSDKKVASAKSDISMKAGGRAASMSKASLTTLPKDVKKRWLIVGAGVAVAIAGATTFMQSNRSAGPAGPRNAPVTSIDTTPKGLNSQQDWRAQTGAELQALRKSLAESQATQKELTARLEALRQDVSTAKTAAAVPSAATGPSRIDFNLPPPPAVPTGVSGVRPATGPQQGIPPVGTVPRPGTSGAASSSGSAYPVGNSDDGSYSSNTGTYMPAASSTTKRTAARGFVPDGAGADAIREQANREGAIQKMVSNEKQGYLPAGSFAAATLISGVEAFTGGTAQSQPQPIVIRVDENAILPNNAGYKIKGCHVLASVYGDLSSERVFGRTSTLTCVDSNDRLVLSEEVEGNLIDSDGKNGIRGEIQDRQGAKLARSLLAGFAQGMASAFGSAQNTTIQGAAGLTTALTGSSFKAAGYGGAGKATEQLAEFYMKQAETTMPIIAVDAGRKISVLFTKSKSLKFESVDTYKVQREGSINVERKPTN